MRKHRNIILIFSLFHLFTFSPLFGQRMTESLHKLQYAEMVINSLYVDSVDEVKLVEDRTLHPRK